VIFGVGKLSSALASASKFCPRPRPRPRRFVLGLGLGDLSSASASRICPRLTSLARPCFQVPTSATFKSGQALTDAHGLHNRMPLNISWKTQENCTSIILCKNYSLHINMFSVLILFTLLYTSHGQLCLIVW